MLDQLEELALQVSHLIPFIWFGCEGCFKGFPVIKYTYLACLKVALWFVFAICFYGLLGSAIYIEIPVKLLRWSFLQN